MTYPVGGKPDGAWQWGSRYGQDITEQSAKATMTNGVAVKWTKTQEEHHTNVPIDSPMWKTLDGNEESTFPRASLSYGSSWSTASGGGGGGSGSTSHSHNLNEVPDFQPAGNWLQLGFIKIQMHCKLNAVGFITGDSQTWLNTGAAYASIYKMDDATGNLTRIWVSGDIRSSVTAINTETRIALPTVISARQTETYAVGILTQTSGLQKPGSLMCTTQTNINRGTGGEVYPRRGYGQAGEYASGPPPVTIPETSLYYGQSNKLPFLFLRRASNG